MLPERILLTEGQWQAMREHVQSCLPEEGCGLLGGEAGRVQLIEPITNSLHSSIRYKMDPKEQVDGLLKIEATGYELVGIFHSHPMGPVGPSDIDIAQVTYPEAVYLIWSIGPTGWDCHAFRLDGETPEEIPLKIIP